MEKIRISCFFKNNTSKIYSSKWYNYTFFQSDILFGLAVNTYNEKWENRTFFIEKEVQGGN